ncbi:MAG: M10 family metallopeptidase C-terminal domain-containing protein [Gammaproteobacteria bacterium]
MTEPFQKLQATPLTYLTRWTGSSINYTFLQSFPSYYLDSPGYATWYENKADTSQSPVVFSAKQMSAIHFLLEDSSSVKITGDYADNVDYRVSYSDVINYSFSEQTQVGSSVGDITFLNVSLDTSTDHATAFYPELLGAQPLGVGAQKGDVLLNKDDTVNLDGNIDIGEQGFWVLFHEIGHAFGGLLDADATSLATEFKNQKYTAMSYNAWGGIWASGLQLLDIQALQDTYGGVGANTDTRDGDTTYSAGQGLGAYGSSVDQGFLYTIWDGSGNDTINASEFNVRAEIDLREGHFSSIGVDALLQAWDTDEYASAGDPDPGNVAIAYGVEIENAIGTYYDDIFHGSEGVNNDFQGGDGSDTINYSGTTNGVTVDLGTGQADNDGNDGVDTFDSIENVVGSSHDDIILGSDEYNILDGGLGDDSFYVTEGSDYYNGGWGGQDRIELTSETQSFEIEGDLFWNFDYSMAGTFENIELIVLGSGDDNVRFAGSLNTSLTIDTGEGTDTVSLDSGLSTYDTLVADSYFSVDITDLDDSYTGTMRVYGAEVLNASGGTVHLLELGHVYGDSYEGAVIYDYSGYGSSLTFTFDGENTTVTDGEGTDYYGIVTSHQFVGSNNGDTVTGSGFDTLWLGTGDDTADLDIEDRIVYSGGNDTISVIDPFLPVYNGTIWLAPAIEEADVSFTELNFDWQPTMIIGTRHTGFDLEVDVDGYGTILVENGGGKTWNYGADLTFGTGDDSYETTILFNLSLWDGQAWEIDNNDYVLSGSLMNSLVSTPYNDVLTVTSLDPNLYGGSGDDVLTGDEEANELRGSFGVDTLYGEDGDDYLYGGFDNDVLDGGLGFNIVYGDEGDDEFYAVEYGENVMYGGKGSDTFYIADHTNTVIGGEVANENDTNLILVDIASTDVSISAFGADNRSIEVVGFLDFYLQVEDIGAFSGITFSDITIDSAVLRSARPIYLDVTSSADNVDLSANTTSIAVSLMAGNDEFIGTIYGDVVYGDEDDDTVDGNDGDDYLDGGDGSDTVSFASATVGVSVDLKLTDAQDTGAGLDTIRNFESIIGSSYDDILAGGWENASISAGDGNDTIVGSSILVAVDGGNGTDTLSYADSYTAATASLSGSIFTGIENIVGSNVSDTLTGDGNDNIITGGDGNDTIKGGAGNDALDGGNDIDTLTYAGAGSGITVSLALTSAQVTGGAGTDTISNFEYLTGSSYDDTLTGTSGANVITGGDGNDSIVGGGGNDTLNGGNGNDTIANGAGNDTINGGDGNDTILYSTGDDTINGGNGTDAISYADAASAVTVFLSTTSAQNTGGGGTDTITNTENLTGSDYNDTLWGNSSANTILGGDGNDTIKGAGGNDTLDGGNGTDTADYFDVTAGVTVDLAITTAQNTGGAGTDTLSNFENLTGSKSTDTLYGDASANVIDGKDQNDVLYGRGGADTLTGGATGADTFVFELSTAFSDVDTITDFSTSNDKIDLHDILDLAFDPLTDLIADFVNFTDSGANSIMSVDRDGAGTTYGFDNVATLNGLNGLDETTLYGNGNLLAA